MALQDSDLKSLIQKLGKLMNAADVDGNGTIDYLEFITATMHMNRMDREDHLYTAFQFCFDKDNKGYITKKDLSHGGRGLEDVCCAEFGSGKGWRAWEHSVAITRQVVEEDMELLCKDWEESIAPLTELDPIEFPRHWFSVEQYFAAKTVIGSRAFEIDDYHGSGMAPLADL